MTVQAWVSSSVLCSGASSDSNCLSIKSNSLSDADISYSWFSIWSISLDMLADSLGSNSVSMSSSCNIHGKISLFFGSDHWYT